MGDFQGHPFRGNQYSMPSDISSDSADRPARTHYYHATAIKNLKSIAEIGIQLRKRDISRKLSALTRKQKAAMTPEQRSDATRKGWIVRRRRTG